MTRPLDPSVTFFVILMLATVSYDGVMETPFWAMSVEWMASLAILRAPLTAFHEAGLDVATLLETALLIATPLAFLTVYLAFCWLVRRLSNTRMPMAEIAGLFVLSLVPIAVAYHLSHYLSYLLISGQRLIPLASDPFGIDWNLFGTADFSPDIGIVGARFVWRTALALIIVGHVFGVIVAHFVALRVFETPRMALRSQYPLLVLMVGYTMLSLWILAQPITEREPDLIALRTQSETVEIEAIGMHEVCHDLFRGNSLEFGFEAQAPLRFEIHHHEGNLVRIVAARTGATAHSDVFVADRDQTYCLLWINPNLTPVQLSTHVTVH